MATLQIIQVLGSVASSTAVHLSVADLIGEGRAVARSIYALAGRLGQQWVYSS